MTGSDTTHAIYYATMVNWWYRMLSLQGALQCGWLSFNLFAMGPKPGQRGGGSSGRQRMVHPVVMAHTRSCPLFYKLPRPSLDLRQLPSWDRSKETHYRAGGLQWKYPFPLQMIQVAHFWQQLHWWGGIGLGSETWLLQKLAGGMRLWSWEKGLILPYHPIPCHHWHG